MRKTQKKAKLWFLYQKWKNIDKDHRKLLTATIPAAIVHSVLLAFWSAGITTWLNENAGIGITVHDLIWTAFFMAIVLEAAIVTKMFGMCVVLFGGILAWMAFPDRLEIITGWHMWLDGLQNAISNYYQIDIQLTTGSIMEGKANLFYYLMLVLFILLTNITMVRWRTAWVTVLMTGLSLVMSLLLDVFPEISVVMISVTACVGLWAFTAVGEMGDETPLTSKALKTGSLAVVLIACIIGGSYWLAQNYVMDNLNSRYDIVKEYPQKMMSVAERVIEHFSGSPKGQLSNQPPLQSGKVQLKIWTDEKQTSGIYLKDFTGAHFNQDAERWETVSDQELKSAYQKWSASEQWSYDEAKNLLSQQLYRCLERLGSDAVENNYIISNILEDHHCTWAPYGIDLSGLEMEGDSYIKTSSQNAFKGYTLPDIDTLLSTLSEGDVINQDEMALFQDYSRYVYDHYLDIPEHMPSLEQAVGKIQAENGDLSLQQWVAEIQNVLWQECTYDKYYLEPVSDGSNRIEDFFGKQKKGYCVHFASAGVVMLRMAGIPARYAEGYVVWPNDFQKEGTSNGYEADITGYRGHAWAEVYDQTHGIWIPVDMTPSDSVMAENAPVPATDEIVDTTVSSETNVTETTSTETKTAVSESTENTTESVLSTETEKKEQQSNETEDTGRKGVGHKMIWMLIPVLMLVIVGFRQCFVMRQASPVEKSRHRASRNRAILSLWQQLTEKLDQSGIKPEKELDDWQYVEWLASRVQTLDENELIFLMEKLHQAAYSEEQLTDEEYEQCVQICREIKKNIEKEK